MRKEILAIIIAACIVLIVSSLEIAVLQVQQTEQQIQRIEKADSSKAVVLDMLESTNRTLVELDSGNFTEHIQNLPRLDLSHELGTWYTLSENQTVYYSAKRYELIFTIYPHFNSNSSVIDIHITLSLEFNVWSYTS